ncbi:hypothetical protein [Actinomadura sp. DC4]|uniref:hypothetical protein n=1 Tax=Actinomadura sp. DC4 TaxID=3055069 RepID=UPI0025AF2054|nr:hypothetical protein [Actinomadura sp. DC4]MDN3353035.1 hypothetical protein [Actinomadura sp. DC4]
MLRLTQELEGAVVARWCRDSAGRGMRFDGTRTPESARLRCCRAVLRFLDSLAPESDFAAVRVERAALHGLIDVRSSSTLYATFGQSARHSLAGRLTPELSAALGRRKVGDNVLVETKVLSYRPYRDAWLAGLDESEHLDRRVAAESLVRILARWARGNPRLAAAGGHLPPLSAIEDLRLIGRQAAGMPEIRAFLSYVSATATHPRGLSPEAVLETVDDELIALLGFTRRPHISEILSQIAEPLAEIEYLLPRLGSAERDLVTGELEPRFAGLIRVLRGESVA